MIHLSSQQLLKLLPQRNHEFGDFDITSVVIDSRQVTQGSLFIAIRGERFDGHQFVRQAENNGARAAVVDSFQENISIPQYIVENTRGALAGLANFWRKKTNPKLIAITGSNGKTTVKEMLGKILSVQGKTLLTEGNYNNEIGVPLSLFRLSQDDQYAVIEMGANHRGEIKNLVAIAEPDIVYVNNARAAHLEGFGSLRAVIEAKGEMYQYCKASADAVYNNDEESVDYWKEIAATRKQFVFSTANSTDANSVDISGTGRQLSDGISLSISFESQQFITDLAVFGEHNMQNAMAAISLAIVSGLTAGQACQNLRGFSGVKGRQQFLAGLNDSLIINDSYNANPDSLQAAINVLCALDGEHWLALGDMAEIGEQSLQLHRQALTDAKQKGVDKLFAFGEMSCKAADVFAENAFCFAGHSEMADFIAARLQKNINLLVKGSRSAAMEKVVKQLIVDEHTDVNGVNHAV